MHLKMIDNTHSHFQLMMLFIFGKNNAKKKTA